MSGDELLISLLQSGEDIHASVGHELTGKPLAVLKKDREARTAFKGLHFGIIYGMVPDSLYYKLMADAQKNKEPFNYSREDVFEWHATYFKRFKRVKEFIERQHEFAEKHGYVETLFGFPREIAIAGDESRQTYWANQAVNTPIQGTAHQLMLVVMAIMELKKKTYSLLQRPSMEVHDSLYVFTMLKQLVKAYQQFMHLMEKDVLVYVKKLWPEINWVVPLRSEAKAGFRLGVMVEYAGQSPEEFIDMWCQRNRDFEQKMWKQIRDEVPV